MKFKLTKPLSTDAGAYIGIDKSTFQWNTPVEGEYLCPKKKGILVLGKEFIRLGGLSTCFQEDTVYVWGCFEECD